MSICLPSPNTRWSLELLADAAGDVLDAMPVPAGARPDGRVNPRPDLRTLRYYQSVGLLDRADPGVPRSEGYGYRHLLQVVATKALQALGQPLAQIQRGLAGRTTAELEAAIRPALGNAATGSVPTTGPVRFVTVEIAPGLLVTIDPSRHDVDSTLRHLLNHLPPGARP